MSITVISSSFNQLSFSGGWSFGAIELGIIKKIMETNSINYNLYTGISAGAINAGFLSYYSDINKGIKEAKILYSKMNNHMIYKLSRQSKKL